MFSRRSLSTLVGWLPQIELGVQSGFLNLRISVTSVAERPILRSLAVAEPNVTVLGRDVGDEAADDDLLEVAVGASLIAKRLRVAPPTPAPLVEVVFFHRNFKWFFVVHFAELVFRPFFGAPVDNFDRVFQFVLKGRQRFVFPSFGDV